MGIDVTSKCPGTSYQSGSAGSSRLPGLSDSSIRLRLRSKEGIGVSEQDEKREREEAADLPRPVDPAVRLLKGAGLSFEELSHECLMRVDHELK